MFVPKDIESKINRLLQLTGTPPDKQILARDNYLRLYTEQGAGELDKRIKEFEEMNQRVDGWHRSRFNFTKGKAFPTHPA
jgi:hypothetical protein